MGDQKRQKAYCSVLIKGDVGSLMYTVVQDYSAKDSVRKTKQKIEDFKSAPKLQFISKKT